MQSGGLTKKQEQATLWLADGQMADEAIAAKLHINPATLWRWKQQPDFAAVVAGHKARWAAEIEQEGIANRQNRVDALNDRWALMQRVIEARAADATMTGAGHETGLLVRTYKPGKYKTVEEYRVDVGLLAELRAHELQAARELGQLVEKRELTGKDGAAIQHEVEHGGAIEVRAVDYRQSIRALAPPLGEEEGAA